MPPTPKETAALGQKLDVVQKQIEQLRAAKAAKKMTPSEIRQGLDLLMQKYNYSPLENLIITSQQTDNESLSTKIDMFLLEFLLPKLKSVEVSGQVDHTHTVVIRRFGSDGRIEDTPVKRLPGAPISDPSTRKIMTEIDAEVSRG